jgi:uncharacterized protein (DUF1778 family)
MSVKVYDGKGRWRNKIVSFRVSPEEDRLIEQYVRLSGLTKQDYIINRLLQKDIVVVGNPRVYKALRDSLTEVLAELRGGEQNDDLIEVIEQINTTLNGLKEGNL